MSSTIPRFFSQPFRYIRWAANEKPAIFFSLIVGSIGPVLVLTVPKIRHRLGDGPRPQIPLTYPIPSGPRKPLRMASMNRGNTFTSDIIVERRQSQWPYYKGWLRTIV
ncbi:hypothetical protein EYC84_008237 [Monilinia fructicola]|uniref:NADH-ubiquinone oxidoreductase 9.5 kDa subunit n=1 Tax=Monilinia fructicola TaxID=38448 RepID=A0A5M9JEP3_MONFR|nr:hypothetical protein EYC84_008237 [Monilinia fructicola]